MIVAVLLVLAGVMCTVAGLALLFDPAVVLVAAGPVLIAAGLFVPWERMHVTVRKVGSR